MGRNIVRFEPVGYERIGPNCQTNWQVAPPPPPAFRVTLSRPGDMSSWAAVARADGRDLVFIASVEPHRFRSDSYSGPRETLLFYDPVESIAVQTFDW